MTPPAHLATRSDASLPSLPSVKGRPLVFSFNVLGGRASECTACENIYQSVRVHWRLLPPEIAHFELALARRWVQLSPCALPMKACGRSRAGSRRGWLKSSPQILANSTFPHGSRWKSAGLAKAGRGSDSTQIVRCKLSANNCRSTRRRSGANNLIRFSARVALATLISSLMAIPLVACGPNFPNHLLVGGDHAVLRGAEICFDRELQRLNLVPTRHKAMAATNDFATEAQDAELAELALALAKARVGSDESARIVATHMEARKKLTAFVAELKVVEDSRPWVHEGEVVTRGNPTLPWPKMPVLTVTPGLPAEFADYFEGALAWHNPFLLRKEAARQCWERLLERPDGQRKYKSVWAAFMLARSWLEEDQDKAKQYLRLTRALASRGFADPIGLAAASLGVEARVELLQTNYAPAIELYLEQMAAGDDTAANSLRFLCAQALRSPPDTLQRLASNLRCQKVITAYILSQSRQWNPLEADEEDGTPSRGHQVRNWLKAIEAAGIKDADSAEKFALAAYRNNDMESAQRWIKLAGNAPVAQWIQAKLLLRAGKVPEAAAILAKVSRAFPVEPHGTNEVQPVLLKATLVAGNGEGSLIPVERQVLGELGVLRLARREFTQSLDALLNAGFWMDAAYVAERVLTLEELRVYVDAYWPPVSAAQLVEEQEKFGEDEVSPAKLREQIRYLLARRLMRASRGNEAREYYPEQWMPPFDVFVQSLNGAWDQALPADQRATAFFQAAVIARTNGMELLGTEVEPDWRIHAGNFETGVSTEARKTEAPSMLPPIEEELGRSGVHQPVPNLRYHYRYQAASLAWEAAQLLPDNSDLTAYILWRGGTWLKYQDPPVADIFYKALVNRNRRTVLGAAADKRRWFPELDENGNIVPARATKVNTTEESPGPESDAPQQQESGPETAMENTEEPGSDQPVSDRRHGQVSEGQSEQVQSYARYIVHQGDTLASILRGAQQAGLEVTWQDLLQANPGLDAARLMIGQVIRIPTTKTAQAMPEQ